MKKSTKKKIKTKYLWFSSRVKIVIKLIIILILLAILTGGIIFYVKYGKDILDSQQRAKDCVSASTLDTFKQNQTSIVYDSNGEIISTVKGDKDSYYIEFEDIPKYAKDAMVTTEDRTFYEHDGLDYKANLAAVISLIENKGEIKRGGSTITQQLARNIFLSHEVTWKRKIDEIFIAQELEKKYDKYQILEFYFNNIYFANGYYGIQAAAKGYFNKSVTELTLSQITFLCAIPNNPTMYDPLTNFDNVIERRDRILQQMFEAGEITSEEMNIATSEEITLNMTKKVVNDYVETYVYYCATRALMAKNGFVFRNNFEDADDKQAYEEEYSEVYNQCQQMLFSKGYRIYTSIDMEKQASLQESINKELEFFDETKENGIFALQGAAVCIDNDTGRVIAIVGGRKQDTVGYTLNRGFQSYRQPGSAIKPILLYTPAFEMGYTPNSIVVDEEIEDGPKNAGGGYLGEITLRKAVESSVNTVAWNMYEELTPTKCLGYLVGMDFQKITYEDTYPAASLGGTTYGASPLEIAAAYACLENDGVYTTPTCIVKIMNAQGEEIVGDPSSKKEVYDKNSARTMTNVLKGVMTVGTAKGYAIPSVESAGKTGTTDNKKDGWFVGYTPYYTTAVWVGYDMPRAMEDLKGNTYPLYIWYDFMEKIHSGLEYRSFEVYEEVDATVPDKTATPKETDKPKETEKPKATEKPKNTEKPKTTESPKDTKKPESTESVKTKAPVSEEADKTQEPVDTKKPEKTKEPVDTKAPEDSEDPVNTKEPEESKGPVDTKEPEESEGPVDTKVPEKSKAPIDTKKPEESGEPLDTKIPPTESTKEPEESEEPVVTKEPVASETDSPTKEPTKKPVTVAPEPTKKATLAPSEWTPYPLPTQNPSSDLSEETE